MPCLRRFFKFPWAVHRPLPLVFFGLFFRWISICSPIARKLFLFYFNIFWTTQNFLNWTRSTPSRT